MSDPFFGLFLGISEVGSGSQLLNLLYRQKKVFLAILATFDLYSQLPGLLMDDKKKFSLVLTQTALSVSPMTPSLSYPARLSFSFTLEPVH